MARDDIEQRHALVLRAWEAVNTERELDGVLAAIAEVLVPVVRFDAVAISVFDARPGRRYALHLVGKDRPRGRPPEAPEPPSRPGRPYVGSESLRRLQAGEPYVCTDLLAQETWLPHEPRLAAVGIRSYASIPLFVRGGLLGTAVFTRRQPGDFQAADLMVLSDVSRALAVAFANVLANEEIHQLRDQLEAENVALRSQLGDPGRFTEIVGESAALRRVLEAVEQVAATDATVLITGETGTGKELIVRALHRLSPRASSPLVKVHCAAIPDTLIAAELFGHERGAFTGAVERRKGRFEQAHRGTLFLDEIGELSPEVQVMLLRVLQEREVERLGGGASVPVDVRLVAATNRDLAEEVRAGRFRSDLYYRLNVFPIRLPPLRERPEDIPLLAACFADKHGSRFGRPIARIDKRSMRRLETYAWPGNVRELEHVIERAVILSRNGTLRIDPEALPGMSATGDLGGDLRARERDAIESALRTSAGRVAGPHGAASHLGLAPSTLEFRIKRLGIDKLQFRASRRAG
jgi:formate hydrogenlyase transcriptional activator